MTRGVVLIGMALSLWLGGLGSAFVRGQSAQLPPAITNSLGMKMVCIPAGRFTMGSPVDEFGSKPNEAIHKVELTRPFYLGVLEVTEKQYAEVMGLKPRTITQRNANGRVVGTTEVAFSNLPVWAVNWLNANEFCARLSQLSEEKKLNRSYRLPTEAEWEYACRAGTQTAYTFGDDPAQLGDYAWFGGNTRGQPQDRVHEGGLKKPNAWGLYDMHGNVSEWCLDLFANYREGFATDPLIRSRGPVFGLERVVARGGSYSSRPEYCRSAYRLSLYADDPGGFRVAMTVAGPGSEADGNPPPSSAGNAIP